MNENLQDKLKRLDFWKYTININQRVDFIGCRYFLETDHQSKDKKIYFCDTQYYGSSNRIKELVEDSDFIIIRDFIDFIRSSY